MNQSEPGRAPGLTASAAASAVWRRRAGELALACAGSFPSEEPQRLHELRRLIAEAPVAGLVRGLAMISAERIDQLIAADASAEAALAMLGPECGYLISRGAGGQHLASVILPGTCEESSASGETLALALIGALGLALVESDVKAVEGRPAVRDLRLN
ncbi:MAG TPA: hypothetical protein VFP14_02250 [Novosphingobium sp.]|nr:hypothetical protein [Novosphingobium sp.]